MKKSIIGEYLLKKNTIYYNGLFKILNNLLDVLAKTKKSNKGF